MAQKWNLGDIVPPERGRRPERHPSTPSRPSLSDVRRGAHTESTERPLPPHSRHHTDERERISPLHESHHTATEETDTLDDEVRELEIRIGKRARTQRIVVITLIVLVALGIGIGSTTLMSGAEITVMPKSRTMTVSGVFEAHKSPTSEQLGYEVLAFEESGERTVAASGQEKVAERASGMMTIQNAYSSTKQRLIKNTRFESSNGLIYRITESVEIPGYTKSADGAIVPGIATAKVIADGTGEQYNIPAGSFTIPGLKGSEQYAKVTGSTKEPMTGGFEGMKFIIDEGELSTARQELHLELRGKLFARLQSERPNGFVFYEPSVTFEYISLPPTEAAGQSVTIKEQVRLMAPLFKSDSFASHVAKRAIPGYEGEPVRLADAQALSFSYPASSTNLSSADSFEFNLSGQPEIVYVYDAEQLRSRLLGMSQQQLPQVLADFPAIERSKAIIKPFWRDSFPKDVEKIRIVESKDAFR